MGRGSNYTNFNNRNSITSKPTYNYSKYILEQINKIRIDPQSFIGVIEDAKNYIIKDKLGRIIYNGKMRIALANGESSFNEAIEFLKNADSMEPLKQHLFGPSETIKKEVIIIININKCNIKFIIDNSREINSYMSFSKSFF